MDSASCFRIVDWGRAGSDVPVTLLLACWLAGGTLLEGLVIGFGCVAIVASCASAFAVYKVLTIPDAPRLHAAVAELIGRVEEIASHNSETRRGFRQLELDVEAHLESASVRLKRSRTAEATNRRTSVRQAEAAETEAAPLTLEQQRTAAESAMFDDLASRR